MDIEQFYDADPRRRASEELELGRDWHDADGVRFELSWVIDTGELYLMKEPVEAIEQDPFGDTLLPDLPMSQVTVEILGTYADRAALDAALAGWREQMGKPDSVSWLHQRVQSA
jgi:hypothetical protein